jgi:hypothetical protein
MADLLSRPASGAPGERNIGTLWTLERGESTVRCGLWLRPDCLELRAVMDGAILRSECCEGHAEAFELAARWQARMIDRGWRKVSPRLAS